MNPQVDTERNSLQTSFKHLPKPFKIILRNQNGNYNVIFNNVFINLIETQTYFCIVPNKNHLITSPYDDEQRGILLGTRLEPQLLQVKRLVDSLVAADVMSRFYQVVYRVYNQRLYNRTIIAYSSFVTPHLLE